MQTTTAMRVRRVILLAATVTALLSLALPSRAQVPNGGLTVEIDAAAQDCIARGGTYDMQAEECTGGFPGG